MTESLRYFRLWAAIGWSLVALVVYMSLGPPDVAEGVASWDKAGHLGAYCTLMLWFSQLYLRRSRLIFAFGFIAMGLTLELLQGGMSYRSFELLDIVANATGVVLGWILGAWFFAGWLRRAELWIQQRSG